MSGRTKFVRKVVGSALALYLTSLASFILFAALLPIAPGPYPATGMLGFGPALLLVHALTALVVVLLALRSCRRGRQLALLLFTALFGVQVLLQIETLAFRAYVGLPAVEIGRLLALGALHAAAIALVAAWLFRTGTGEAEAAPAGLTWRIGAAVLAYMACYFVAGHLIAWSDEAVRAYYGDGADIDRRMVLLLQLFRGLLWSLLALCLALRLRGPAWARVATMSFVLAVLAAAPLIYPNTYMPVDVARVHLVELAISQALWGGLAALLLGPTGRGRLPD